MELSHYLPDLQQTVHLPVAVLTIVGLAAIGGTLSGSRRDPLFDVFAGFGAVTGTMTILGVVTSIPFSWMAIGFWFTAAAAVAFVWQRARTPGGARPPLGLLVKVFVLALPVLLPVSAMQASQWDEFSQWLHNALYLYKFDAFPTSGLPESPSVFAAYPHGNQLFAFLVSYASGSFVEMGVAFGNVLMLLVLAPVYVAMVRFGNNADAQSLNGWLAAAVGILGVTVLSTTFVQKLVFTAYSDTSTAVLMCVLGVLLWHLLNDLAFRSKNANTLAWQFALACMFFINIRQTNLVLLFLLLSAGLLIALRDPDIPVGKFAARLPIMLVLPAIVYLSWRFHVSTNIASREFSLLPQDKWLVDHAFTIFGRMFSIASKKGAYFGMMTAIAVAGIWCFFKGSGGKYGRLLFMTGAVFVGNWLFLWAMYIAAFGVGEGMRAASFWRYNTQLGLLGALTAAVAIGMLYMKCISPVLAHRADLQKTLSALLIVGVVTAPIIFNYKIRIDIRPQIEHMRNAGKDLSRIVPAGAKLVVLDPKGQGLADLIIKYEVLGFSLFDPVPDFIYRIETADSSWQNFMSRIEKLGVTHIWVHQNTERYTAGFRLNELRNDGSTLLVKSDNGNWRIEKFWPFDGYTDPYSLPD